MVPLHSETRARPDVTTVVSWVYTYPPTHQDAYIKYVGPFYMSTIPQLKKLIVQRLIFFKKRPNLKVDDDVEFSKQN